MNSQEFIKKLKEILPGREYAENSKRAILAVDQYPQWSFWGSLTESLSTGVSIVLAGALLILIMGGFSSLNPFSLKSLDPVGLKAEAEAIDIQIRLSNLNYNDFTRVISGKKGISSGLVVSTADEKTAEGNTSLTAVIDDTVSSSTENVGVDDILKELSK